MQPTRMEQNARPAIPRRAIEAEMCDVADELDAALFLCGSQFYAGQGEDFDYRMVLPSPLHGLMGLCDRLPGAQRLLPHAARWRPNTIGLKFERHGEPVSVQLHSVEFIRQICALKPVTAVVLRATPTSRSNDVFGFAQRFSTPQPHCALGQGAWLVHIDQDPEQHANFCTQIYHNMVMGSSTLRDRHGFGEERLNLLRGVASETLRHGQNLRQGFIRLMWRNQHRWSTEARMHFFAEIRTAVSSKAVEYA